MLIPAPLGCTPARRLGSRASWDILKFWHDLYTILEGDIHYRLHWEVPKTSFRSGNSLRGLTRVSIQLHSWLRLVTAEGYQVYWQKEKAQGAAQEKAGTTAQVSLTRGAVLKMLLSGKFWQQVWNAANRGSSWETRCPGVLPGGWSHRQPCPVHRQIPDSWKEGRCLYSLGIVTNSYYSG